MRRLVRRFVPKGVVHAARTIAERADPYVMLSYSQDGEDMVLRRLLEGQARGFYVDVGAHHPFRFSNTFHFYRQGWSGINIDANPDAIPLFDLHRPDDINVCAGVGEADAELQFHRFSEGAFNTFDPALAASRLSIPGVQPLDRIAIKVSRLETLLDLYLPPGMVIDFLSIDTEGLDAAVIASNDWDRYRPRFVLVEVLGVGFDDLASDPLAQQMRSHGYIPIAKTCNTLILADSSSRAFR